MEYFLINYQGAEALMSIKERGDMYKLELITIKSLDEQIKNWHVDEITIPWYDRFMNCIVEEVEPEIYAQALEWAKRQNLTSTTIPIFLRAWRRIMRG